MGVSMAAFTTFIEQLSDVLWNSLLLFLLVGTGVYFTVRLRGVQVRRFGEASAVCSAALRCAAKGGTPRA